MPTEPPRSCRCTRPASPCRLRLALRDANIPPDTSGVTPPGPRVWVGFLHTSPPDNAIHPAGSPLAFYNSPNNLV